MKPLPREIDDKTFVAYMTGVLPGKYTMLVVGPNDLITSVDESSQYFEHAGRTYLFVAQS